MRQHHTPQASGRGFVDDTFVILETTYKEEFFQHINGIEEKTQFTAENTRADGSLPFLDTLVTVKEDGSLSTSIYRKPTHTNQYLQWDSYCAIANKYSVINSLLHRAKNICSNQDQLKEELTYVERALTALQVSFMGHTEDEVEEKYSQNKIETLTEPTEAITPTELLSQFHTTRDLVRVLKTLAENMAFKYTLRVERP